MSSSATVVQAPNTARNRLLHRLALIQAVLLLAAVVVALPLAFQSMGSELIAQEARTLYEFPNGQPITAEAEQAAAAVENVLNIAAIDLDADNGSVTLSVSGHRNCAEGCTPLQMTLFSFEDDATVRRALPPSASLQFDDGETFFNQTVQLPIRGRPRHSPSMITRSGLGSAER